MTTSDAVTRRMNSARPSVEPLRSMVMLRLLRLRKWKLAALPAGIPRVWSPSPGRSTLTTSAPRSASRSPAEGPATMCPSSRTRTPSSGSAPIIRASARSSSPRCRPDSTPAPSVSNRPVTWGPRDGPKPPAFGTPRQSRGAPLYSHRFPPHRGSRSSRTYAKLRARSPRRWEGRAGMGQAPLRRQRDPRHPRLTRAADRVIPEMTSEALVDLLRLLEGAGIEVWLDGGWAVDAVLGAQTRPHKDVDIILRVTDLPELRELLGRRGFELRPGGTESNFVLADRSGL